jgi:hypothetical protein
MDYFRTDCIKSYFEIVALVNKGNKVVNEQTEALFFIEQDKLFLGINTKQKVYLCYKEDFWYPGKESRHAELERFISKLLNYSEPGISELNSEIKRNLFKLPS